MSDKAAESGSGIIQFADPTGWRFYRYGRDDGGDPMFSFWMDVGPDTGVCLYERGDDNGRWLDTHHSDDDYAPERPSDELRDVLRQLLLGDGVDSERVESLADHESYFVRIIIGTLEEGKDLPAGVWAFLEDITGTPLEVVDND